MNVCPDAEYEAIAQRAYAYLDQLAPREQESARRRLVQQILEADEQRGDGKETNSREELQI